MKQTLRRLGEYREGATLAFHWTVSRAADTYGYNICTLYINGDRTPFRCNGGGYDMQGTCLGHWVEFEFLDELKALPIACNVMIPTADRPRGVPHRVKDYSAAALLANLKGLGLGDIEAALSTYGMRWFDPEYDPGKAVPPLNYFPADKAEYQGKTVAELEAAGVSLGLERLQAWYAQTAPVQTERHTVPTIDGACGFSSVERILRACGWGLKYIAKTRRSDDTLYTLHKLLPSEVLTLKD